MTKKYTELYTLAEIDEAVASGKIVEFHVMNDVWRRVLEMNVPRRYHIVEEFEEIRQPEFGDEVLVEKHRARFVCPYGTSGVVVILNGSTGVSSWRNWCWPEEVKDD